MKVEFKISRKEYDSIVDWAKQHGCESKEMLEAVATVGTDWKKLDVDESDPDKWIEWKITIVEPIRFFCFTWHYPGY